MSMFAQVEFSLKKHDFGKMDAFAQRYVDVEISNSGADKVYILRVNAEREVRYLYSNKTIEPNSKETLRLKVNPAARGAFKSDVWVFMSSSNQPTIIKLKGYVEELPADASPTCPDFSGNTTMEQQMSFDFKVKVINANTKEPIHKAAVQIIKDGRPAYSWKTNRSGLVEKEFPLGYYYFVTTADNYFPKEFDAFVNRKRNTLVIELVPKVEEQPPIVHLEPKDSIEDLAVTEPVVPEEDFDEIVIDMTEEDEPEDETIVSTPTKIDSSEFSVDLYKPNNIILVLDISSSMNQHGKLDLLKTSMLELLDMLRPVDRIGLVSFSSNARVIAEPVLATAENKESIEAIIKGLRATGKTNGGLGIRTGYKEAMSHYLGKGNNTIILTTDGAFNQEDRLFKKTIKKGVKKDITISVLGVKTVERYKENLQEVADKGHGRFVEIKDYNSALGVLKHEIKTGSKRD